MKHGGVYHQISKHRRNSPAFQGKVHRVMSEFKSGTLHSGGPKGPQVTSRKQAVAIALSEARRHTQ